MEFIIRFDILCYISDKGKQNFIYFYLLQQSQAYYKEIIPIFQLFGEFPSAAIKLYKFK